MFGAKERWYKGLPFHVHPINFVEIVRTSFCSPSQLPMGYCAIESAAKSRGCFRFPKGVIQIVGQYPIGRSKIIAGNNSIGGIRFCDDVAILVRNFYVKSPVIPIAMFFRSNAFHDISNEQERITGDRNLTFHHIPHILNYNWVDFHDEMRIRWFTGSYISEVRSAIETELGTRKIAMIHCISNLPNSML